MSSPASISSFIGAELLEANSDVESLPSVTAEKETYYQIPEDTEGNEMFALGDGDFKLYVKGTAIQTHKYILKRFSVLKRQIEQIAPGHESEGLSLGHSAIDFINTLKILYASPIEDIPDFDTTTLVSSLRTATMYDYPALRTFAVKKLENSQLSAIERVQIAREFNLSSWEVPAYEELCGREEPITEEEADVLGMHAFVQVAKIREKEQRRRGYLAKLGCEELDESNKSQQPVEGHQSDSNETESTDSTPEPATSTIKRTNKKFKKNQEDLAQPKVTNEETTGESNETTHKFKPSFVSLSSSKQSKDFGWSVSNSGALEYKIPGCQCRAPDDTYISSGKRGGKNNSEAALRPNSVCHCTISPCAADALAQLQIYQIAHATSITQIRSAIQHLGLSLTPPENLLVAEEFALPEVVDYTLVQTEVRKWLSGQRSEQTD